MREALKLALEALETCCAGDYSTGHVIDPSFDEDAVNEAITAIKEALAQPAPPFECRTEEEKTAFAFGWWKALETQRVAQPEQEVDWKDQYEKQKRRAEMWIAKYEEVAGPAPCAVPLAQPDYRAVKTYHEGKPVYVSQPEQEPVAWEQFYPDIGKPQLGQELVAIYRAGQAKGEKFHVEFLKEMGDDEVLLYATPPKRPWVGLTDEQREACTQSPFTEDNYDDIEAKLKELNT